MKLLDLNIGIKLDNTREVLDFIRSENADVCRIIDNEMNNQSISSSDIQQIIIYNNDEFDNQVFLSSFNNTLITILNKLHYIISFNNPETSDTNVFIEIN